MDFAEQLDAAHMAIQEAQATKDLTFMVGPAAMVLAAIMIGVAVYYHLQEGTSRTGGFLCAAFLFAAASVTPPLVLQPTESLEQARAEKTTVCEDMIAAVADNGDPALASLALENDCSRDKLLIAALSSGGLSPDLAKALISDYSDPGS